jgi:hypothetical protein
MPALLIPFWGSAGRDSLGLASRYRAAELAQASVHEKAQLSKDFP